eukprot:7294735-Prymnesium_polylepis.1
MARAKRRVGRLADPSIEHARLACAFGVHTSSLSRDVPSKGLPPGGVVRLAPQANLIKRRLRLPRLPRFWLWLT